MILWFETSYRKTRLESARQLLQSVAWARTFCAWRPTELATAPVPQLWIRFNKLTILGCVRNLFHGDSSQCEKLVINL
uniref:Uncharacterized protein n=1 Tax=Strigamia maritima TaxID=126957 RepID=T1J775_STRMM